MSFVIQILEFKKPKWFLENFEDIHRIIDGSLEFKQSVRPSFLLKHSLLA